MRRLISSAILATSVLLANASQANAATTNATTTNVATAEEAPEAPKPKRTIKDVYGKGITVPLNEDGSRFVRFITWHQVWTRFMQFNDGTTLNGHESTSGWDVGLRRSRFLLFGKISPRILIVTHFGINNQNNVKSYPTFFMHDAYLDFTVVPKILNIGAGLHYWNGLSRMSNASTLNFLAVDAPITNWPYINTFDQFARPLGIFLKGKLFKDVIDYRFSINKPFSVASKVLTPADQFDEEGEPVNGSYKPYVDGSSIMFNGYVNAQFLEKEGNTLPYMVGTYIGAKKIFNVGVGFVAQPNAYAKYADLGDDDDDDDDDEEDNFRSSSSMQDDEEGRAIDKQNMFLFSADIFADIPFGDGGSGGALTAYAVYYMYKMGGTGPATIGIMNPAANPAGNAYPMLGDGHHIYGQLGYLLPFHAGITRFQLYATLQASKFTNLTNFATTIEGGLNWFIVGHHAKVTLHYRSRPTLGTAGEEVDNSKTLVGRKSEFILQTQIFF